MAHALFGEDVAIERGGRIVVASLSFRAEQGRALLLRGANGAGKTSLIRACAGLLRPAAGTIGVEGGDDELTIGEQSQLVGHQNALKPGLSVRENLLFWAEFLETSEEGSDRDVPGMVDEALNRFRLRPLADIQVAYLSAGQKRRTALARLLVTRRVIWLLDEPTAALDSAAAQLVVSIVDHHLEAGGIVIAATHQPLPFASYSELRLDADVEAAT